MIKSYKFRIYPTKEQQEKINKNIGCCRFVFNYYLNKRIEVYEQSKETFNYYACAKDLTQLKKQDEFKWLKESESTSLQNSLSNLDIAFKNFFESFEGIAIPLRVLAPTIFIVAVMGTLRGLFQGRKTMLPTAISQIIEQIVNASIDIFI